MCIQAVLDRSKQVQVNLGLRFRMLLAHQTSVDQPSLASWWAIPTISHEEVQQLLSSQNHVKNNILFLKQ